MKLFFNILIGIIVLSVTLHSNFIPNKGQWNENVLFVGEFDGYNAWILKDKIRFDNYNYVMQGLQKHRKGYVYDMLFSKTKSFKIIGTKTNGSKINFINTDTFTAEKYRELKITDLYDNIDARFYAENNHFRYDLILAENADIDQIAIDYSSDYKIVNNELILMLGDSKVYHKDLKAYDINQDIPIDFINKNGSITFRTSLKYDKKLTIDPLIFSTYFGGTRYDFARDMTIDKYGNIYMTGFTSSLNFPTDTGAYSRGLQTSQWDYPDIFVSKFSPDGEKLIFSTYIGGIGDDYGEGIALDTNGNIYITGYTWPVEFPITENSLQDTAQGGYDAFVMKLDSNAGKLLYSTLIGGSKDDYGISIDVSDKGEACFTGYFTSNGNYPVSENAFLRVSRGKYDSFITKLNDDGSEILYSTYLAGSDDDFGQDINLYDDGRVLVCGRTSSSDFLTTPDAFDRDYFSIDTSNAYFSILSNDFSQLVYSSYFGGSKEDGSYAIATDNDDNIYLAGHTESTDLPTSENAYDRILNYDLNFAGNSDAFVAKFTPDGNELIYSTYFGGSAAERAYSLAVDEYNVAYIAGTTTSQDMEITNGAVDTTIAGLDKTSDAFVARFSEDGSELTYSTYFGGSFNEVARSLAVNRDDLSIIISGMTNSTDLETTDDAFDQNYNDTLKADIFLTRIMPSFINFRLDGEIDICQGDTILIGTEVRGGFGNLSYKWEPELFLVDSDSNYTYVYPDTSITYTLIVSDTANHIESDQIRIRVYPLPEFDIFGTLSAAENSTQTYSIINDINVDSLVWSVSNGTIVNQTPSAVDVKWSNIPNGIVRASAHSEDGCIKEDSLLVIIGEKFRFKLNIDQFSDILCEDDFVILEPDQDYEEYYYSDGTRTKLDTIYNTGEYYLIVKNNDGFYGISDTIFVEFIPKPEAFINGQELCYIDSLYTYYLPDEVDVDYDVLVSGGEITDSSGGILNILWGNGPQGRIELFAENATGCRDTAVKEILIGNFGKPIITARDTQGNTIDGTFDLCVGDTIILDAGPGYKSYLWQDSSALRYYKVWRSGIYWVNTIDINDEEHFSDTLEIATLQQPPKPQVSILGPRLRCNTIAKTYQWFLNGELMQGYTERLFEPTQSGNYQVEITASNNCKNISDPVYFDASSVKEALEYGFNITPNPAEDIVEISYLRSNLPFKIDIFNMQGKLVKSIDNIIINKKIDISKFTSGYYNIVFYINDEAYTYKLIVLR